MAKKIRFPLEMEDGEEVRSMEELREHFSLASVLEYIKNGKMVIWLRDRYANDIASLVEELDLADEDLARKVSEIFDVPFDEKTEEELENAVLRAERVKKLKEYTDEEKYISEIDNVAFDQDDLYDLLDEDANVIYLCGNRFSIPLAKHDISYIGITKPVVVIDSKVEVTWSDLNINLENVEYDEKYQAVLDSANATKKKLYEKAVEKVKESKMYSYDSKTFMSAFFSAKQVENIKKTFAMVIKEMENVIYDENEDIKSTVAVITNGLANTFYDENEDIETGILAIKCNAIAGCGTDYINEL